MKKNIAFSCALIILFCLIFGCKKSADKELPVTMNATINGKTFKTSNCVSVLLGGTALFITGGNFSNTPGPAVFPQIALILTVDTNALAGTYNIDSVNNQALLDSSGYLQFAAHSGTVTITATKPQIVGSFEFIMSDSIKVTGGNFVAKHYTL